MIIVRLIGRLGNQLFQYAFAMSVQKRLGTYVVMDDRHMGNVVTRWFDVQGLYQNRWLNRIVYRLHRFPMLYQEGDEDVQTFLATQVKNSTDYFAYFQSEAFFPDIKDTVRERFRIKPRYQEEFRNKYGELFAGNRILAIHYRIGDYIHWHKEALGSKDLTLPESYYRNALASIPDLDDYLVVLVTDDIETCDRRTSYLKSKKIISDTEIMDFQVMMNAEKLIIANSTFGWWAAYLNTKNARVFAPEYWLGFKVEKEFPDGIIPERFTKVRVGYKWETQDR